METDNEDLDGYECDMDTAESATDIPKEKDRKRGRPRGSVKKRQRSTDDSDNQTVTKKRKRTTMILPIATLMSFFCCINLCVSKINPDTIQGFRDSIGHLTKLELSQWVLDWIWTHHSQDGQICYLIGEWRVCLMSFLAVIGMPVSTFYTIKKRFRCGQRKIEGPGGISGRMSNTSQNALQWIMFYANNYAEKTPEDGKLHLPSCLTKASVYGYYKQDMDDKAEIAISESHFYWIWRNCLRHITIPAVSRMSKCTTCMELKAKLNETMDKNLRKKIMELRQKHLLKQSLERRKYYKHTTKARNQPEKYMSLIVDGMDQSKTEIPHSVYPSSLISSIWKLKTHLVGVIAHGCGIYGFFDTYQYPHGSNLTLHVLLNILYMLRDSLPDVLYLQMDNCARENKNRFSVWLKKHSAQTLPKLMTGFEKCTTPKPFAILTESLFDVTGWLQEFLNPISGHSQPHAFKIVKGGNGKAIIKWKKYANDKDWKSCTGREMQLLKDIPNGQPQLLDTNSDKVNVPQLKNDIKKYFSHFPNPADEGWWNDFFRGLDVRDKDQEEQNATWLLPEIIKAKESLRQRKDDKEPQESLHIHGISDEDTRMPNVIIGKPEESHLEQL